MRQFCLTVNVLTAGDTIQPENITQANLDDFVAAFTTAFPGGKLTWNLDNGCWDDSTGSWGWLRSYVAARATGGDLVAYWRTFGFPGGGNAVATENGIYDSYLDDVVALTGVAAANAWHLPAGIAAHLRTTWGITGATAQVWGQEAVDGYSGDGSPNCPYFPSSTNLLVPAQTRDDALDFVVLDCFSAGLWGATSGTRKTVDVVDSGSLALSQAIARVYLDRDGILGPDDYRWLNSGFTPDYLYAPANSGHLTNYKALFTWLAATYPDLEAVTTHEMADEWRSRFGPGNEWAVTHKQVNPENVNEALWWLHTRTHRVAVRLTAAGLDLLDLTRWVDAPAEPTAPASDWTVPARVNQRDTYHPLNPFTVASYRELAPLLQAWPELHTYAR